MNDKEQRRHAAEELQRVFGLSDEAAAHTVTVVSDSFQKLKYLITYWTEILLALEEGDNNTAMATASTMAKYLEEIDEDTLRWIATGAAKLIAEKLLAEEALEEVDPVAAAEEILRRKEQE